MRWALIACLITLAGCAARKTPVAAAIKPLPDNHAREYVDLQAGWRLRIIAPITKSGTYALETRPAEQQGNVITLRTGGDLIGYETAYWAITARAGGGVSLHLTSAEMTTNGIAAPIPTPTRALVHVPKYAHFLRIFYLTRRSAADHDMALLGTARLDRLEEMTGRLRDDPREACVDRPSERVYCEWIPAGMAVRPQVPKTVDGVTKWPE